MLPTNPCWFQVPSMQSDRLLQKSSATKAKKTPRGLQTCTARVVPHWWLLGVPQWRLQGECRSGGYKGNAAMAATRGVPQWRLQGRASLGPVATMALQLPRRCKPQANTRNPSEDRKYNFGAKNSDPSCQTRRPQQRMTHGQTRRPKQ